MSKQPLASVYNRAEATKATIEEWLEARQGKHTRLFVAQSDLIRLLKLEVWALRHRIGLQEVLEIIVPGMQAAIKSKSAKYKNRTGLGVKISALTGEFARNMLSQQIQRLYPDGEQVTLWRERERVAQLQREEDEEMEGLRRHERSGITLLEAPSIDEFISGYALDVEKKRKRMQEALSEKWRKRKRYPSGNPWV